MTPKDSLPDIFSLYLNALTENGYSGDIGTDHVSRLLNATDNSIYQVMPQAVLTPRTTNDLSLILKTAAREEFHTISFMMRGGGTGTNGQSLNDCVTIDCSRYLTRIIDIDISNKQVKIEPGIVLDELNLALKPHGLFFPAHVSPSKSATVGGMVSTDACGKGSCVYGKSGDYVVSMTCILADGTEIQTSSYKNEALEKILLQDREDYLSKLPQLPRGISAYDLTRALDNNKLNMNWLLSGSEGSLAVIKDITLRLIERPAFKAMFIVSYADFFNALRQAQKILSYHPVALETIDDRILGLAKGDSLWTLVREILPKNADGVKGIHFVEFETHNIQSLREKCTAFESFIKADTQHCGYHFTDNIQDVTSISSLRSKCVGLLGNMEGHRRPIPFIEDTAVPPQNLADYIFELKSLLNSYNLECGMFGHVDAGCLHVRPALDMRLTDDENFIRKLSDEVVALLQKHGGILWGEHGKGMRGEYNARLLGTKYYEVMCAVKNLLDPYNKLNPGKIAGPSLKRVDEVPLRGHFDKQIDKDIDPAYAKSTQCNGNGQCFSVMQDETMCPSYKITRDRKHSPKGRAAILREWLRLKSKDIKAANDFEDDVFESLHGCLSCKACTSTCPIHVNIPDMKATFLNAYYKERKRPLRDYIIALSERIAPYFQLLPFPVPAIFGLEDLPEPSAHSLEEGRFLEANNKTIKNVKNPVLILQDAYTSYFDAETLVSILSCIRKIGFEPLLIPFMESGKSWHVKGFIKEFESIAHKNHNKLKELANHNIPIIGIDPSMTIIYRDEYKKLKLEQNYRVLLLHEWLKDIPAPGKITDTNTYKLFLHCTEKTMFPDAEKTWKTILEKFGLTIVIPATGCCGMAGAYGHQKEHIENSRGLFDISWKNKIDSAALVTGFSCRAQVKRCGNIKPKHPLELLNELL